MPVGPGDSGEVQLLTGGVCVPVLRLCMVTSMALKAVPHGEKRAE